jgi:hypothetical protein
LILIVLSVFAAASIQPGVVEAMGAVPRASVDIGDTLAGGEDGR